MAQVNTYTVQVTRGDRYWLVHVPSVDRYTQARHLREVDEMARDLVATMAGVEPDLFELDVHVAMPESAAKRLAYATELREVSRRSQSEAAEEVRAAARELKAAGMPLRDIGILLDVSYQRAGQLVGAS